MPERLLHALVIPDDSQLGDRGSSTRRTEKQGSLGAGGVPVARAVSPDPGERVLEGTYSGKFAEMQATMLEELFEAPAIESVPYAVRDGRAREDGYYVPSDVEPRRPNPRQTDLSRFEGTLVRKGTRSTHWRSVDTAVSTETNPFGSDAAPEFGVDSRATKVQWYNKDDGSLESATVQRTNETEHGSVDVYDASAPSITDPTLIYDLPYTREWRADCRVWDTYGRPKLYTETSSKSSAQVGSATVGSATVGESPIDLEVASQWQRVYVPDHEWRGSTVVENDRLRIEVDRPESRLKAFRWNDRDEIYETVALGQSDWRVHDFDVTVVGLSRVEAQIEFRDNLGDGSNSGYVNMHLYRGLSDAVFFETANGGSIQSGIQDLLSPIAATTDDVPVANSGIVPREETRR